MRGKLNVIKRNVEKSLECALSTEKYGNLILYCKDRAFWNEIVYDRRNAHVFNVSVYSLLPYMFWVSGFLLARLQRQVYNFDSGPSLLGMMSATGR
jgi:hypothetical protein